MRKQVERWIAIALCLCIWSSCMVSLHATNTQLPVSFSPENPSVTERETDQTVKATLQLNQAKNVENFIYTIRCAPPIELVSVVIGTKTLEKYRLTHEYTINGTNITNAQHLGELTFKIPANTPVGQYNIVLETVGGQGVVIGNDTLSLSAQTTINVLKAGSYTASLSGGKTASVGDTVEMKVTVSGNDFASSAFSLTYDADRLEFKSADGSGYSAQNGKVTVTDFGATKTAPYEYNLTFQAKKEGETTVTLTQAAFGTASSAETDDLKAAALNTQSVAVTIGKQKFGVTLPSIFEGSTTVVKGEAYTFTAKDIVNYTYGTVTATMGGGESFTVASDGNGSYTIDNATGELVIQGERTPNQYNVTFQTSTAVALPQNGKATYGQDYSFTMPNEANYTISIESIQCKGQNVAYTQNGSTVTIAGKDVLGDVLITLKKVRSNADVSIGGAAAGELTASSNVAVPGKDFSVTLSADPRYSYLVTATVNGVEVTLTKDGNKYTINGSDVKLGDIEFTVEKTLITNLDKSEYLGFDRTMVWLVQNKVAKIDNTVYTYDGQDMLWSNKYNAYCYLVIAQTSESITADKLSFREGATASVEYDMDVNGSGKVDMNDAQLIHNLYNNVYKSFTSTVTMEKVLRADVNVDGKVDMDDARAIANAILAKP